jgi:hypothetical protein
MIIDFSYKQGAPPELWGSTCSLSPNQPLQPPHHLILLLQHPLIQSNLLLMKLNHFINRVIMVRVKWIPEEISGLVLKESKH